MALPSYALTLLISMGAQSLGTATIWIGISTFNVSANNFLQALIVHSPSRETMAQEFMVELGKCEIISVRNLVDALDGDRSVSPDDWATAVAKEIRENDGNMMPLTNLASHYLSHLIVAFRIPGSIRTRQEYLPPTSNPTPNFTQIEEINSLPESWTVRRDQAALEKLVLRRDGTRCLITSLPFVGRGRMNSNCAHIIPLSIHNKTAVQTAIEMFTDNEVTAEEVERFINHPTNAIVIEHNAHVSMNQHLAWGIEARSVNDGWRYYYRVVRPDDIYGTIQLNDGDEIQFGKGGSGDTIPLPDGRLCNLHLIVARVFAALGAVEVVDKIVKDWEDDQSPYNPGPW